jgi:hypothetical protein
VKKEELVNKAIAFDDKLPPSYSPTESHQRSKTMEDSTEPEIALKRSLLPL